MIDELFFGEFVGRFVVIKIEESLFVMEFFNE